MEFLLVILPVISIFVIVLMSLFCTFILSKIVKFKIELPYAKIILISFVLTIFGSVLNIMNSPITRPTANSAIDDTHSYKVDAYTEIKAPVMKDNSFKSEEVDVFTLEYKEKITEHNNPTKQKP